jgi:hypothetical protein
MMLSGNNERNACPEDEKSSTVGSNDRQSTNNFMDEGERDSPVFRESSERPILKLSVRLIDTYKNINKVIPSYFSKIGILCAAISWNLLLTVES